MKKRKVGRPALGRVKFNTTLPEKVVKALREIGYGNASAGICQLVEAEMKRRTAK